MCSTIDTPIFHAHMNFKNYEMTINHVAYDIELFANLVTQDGEIVYSAALLAAGENFLLPFTNQPFRQSVAAIKTLVASNETLSRKHVVEMEARVFGENWASKDNKAATARPEGSTARPSFSRTAYRHPQNPSS